MRPGQEESTEDRLYEGLYVILAALFVAALVSCNLIFLKFFAVPIRLPWGPEFTFEQSVGLLAYPFTFLVTDILSEVYGRRRANRVVLGGFFCYAFVVALISISDAVPARPGSRVDDATFHRVFGLSWVGMTASVSAYAAAQFLDIRFFHFWRRLTKGRHLWLRNNASTICSQVVDTILVIGLLSVLEVLPWGDAPLLIWNGIIFKWIFAALDTPLFYGATFLCRQMFPTRILALEAEELA